MTIEPITRFSPDRIYRYTLWRIFERNLFESHANQEHFVQFIGLNPSTADENVDDNTIRRCISYAKDCGYGAFCMTNIFAYRDTDPNGMKRYTAPIGPENDHWIQTVAEHAGLIVAAWGCHGEFNGRGERVKELLRGYNLTCLKKTAEGHPRHPLYLAKALRPIPYF